MRKRVLSAAIVVTTALGLAPPAGAATEPPSRPIVKDLLTKADRSVTYKAPVAGFLTVRTAASDRSDWDLDVRDAKTAQTLASSHGFGSHEVAQMYVTAGQRVVARGTKLSGRARQARVSFKLFEIALPKADGIPSLVTVKYSDDEDLERIEAAGLDLTHHIHGGKADVIVTGAAAVRGAEGPRPEVRARGGRPQPAVPPRPARPTAPRWPRRRLAAAQWPRGATASCGLSGRAQGAGRREPGARQAGRAAASGPSRAARSWASRSPTTSSAPTTAARPTS